MKRVTASRAVIVAILLGVWLAGPTLHAADAPDFARLDATFENYRLDAHIPGMVFGVVMD